MDYKKLSEEPLKSAVMENFFKAYKYTQIGNIDFVIAKHITEKGMRSLFEDMDVSPAPQHDRRSAQHDKSGRHSERFCHSERDCHSERACHSELVSESLKSILWAEAKQGTSHDIYESFVQLILTIGREKTFEKYGLSLKIMGKYGKIPSWKQ